MADGPARTAVPTAVALAALVLAAPRPPTALAALAAAPSSADPTGPLVAVLSLLAWAVTAWLALTTAVVLLSRVPGLLGRTARALARRVAPMTVRRAVEASLGLTVAVGVLAPPVALAAPAAPPVHTAQAAPGTEAAWDLDWPDAVETPTAEHDRPRPAAPPPAPGTGSAAPPSGTPATVGAAAARARAAGPPAVPSAAGRPPAQLAVRAAVVVRPGDSLWSLAEAALRSAGTPSPTDRQVAQAWPRWWTANRDAVGDDPDLLLPGTVLHPPASSP